MLMMIQLSLPNCFFLAFCSSSHNHRILRDAACGLQHLHASGKVHRDVKAENIIIAGGPEEKTMVGKIADFGLSCGERRRRREVSMHISKRRITFPLPYPARE